VCGGILFISTQGAIALTGVVTQSNIHSTVKYFRSLFNSGFGEISFWRA